MRGCSAPRGPWRRGAFYPERSSVPAISSARPRAQGARLLPPGAGSGSCESSRAAAAAPAAPVGRRPPSPSPLPPRSSWDPPACAPRQGQQGGCDAPVPGSPEPNLRVSPPQSWGSTMTPRQHHTVISAAAEKKKSNPFEKGVGWGQTGLGLRPGGSTGKGPSSRGTWPPSRPHLPMPPLLPVPLAPPLEAHLLVFSLGSSDPRNLSKQKQRVGGVRVTTVPTS